MIATFKAELQRIADGIPTECQFLAIDELQKFANDYKFPTPLINLQPMTRLNLGSDSGGVVVYDGTAVIDVLTLANVGDTENVKDGYIDQCLDIAEIIQRELKRNSARKFINPTFDLTCEINRFKTSNYCVGVTCTLSFSTGCNRI